MLKLRSKTITDLPYEVLEQAHWRPQEAQLCCKYKKSTTQSPEYQRLRRYWRQNEVNFNFSLDALLMCLTPSQARSIAEKLSGLRLGDTYLLDGYCGPLKKLIGVPDFILGDSSTCILGENKLSATYSWDQFVKYQTFAMLCRAVPELPSTFVNMIIVRDPGSNHFVSQAIGKWNPTISGGEMVLNSSDQDALIKEMRANAAKLAALYPEEINLRQLLSESEHTVPTIAVSWSTFFQTFEEESGRPDLHQSIENIRAIANGNFEIGMTC